MPAPKFFEHPIRRTDPSRFQIRKPLTSSLPFVRERRKIEQALVRFSILNNGLSPAVDRQNERAPRFL